MEYCLVNIVLGDTALPKPIPPPPPPEPPKPEKTFDYAPPKVGNSYKFRHAISSACIINYS